MARLAYARALRAGMIAEDKQLFPPRTKPPVHMPRFFVPAGTPCAVRRLMTDTHHEWRTYRTAKDTEFERYERYESGELGGFYEFRQEGWLMLVSRRFVRHREDAYQRSSKAKWKKTT